MTTERRRSVTRFTRRWHRRLGVVVGIQLMIWTAGGVIFSWVHINNVRGEDDMAEREPIPLSDTLEWAGVAQILGKSKLTTVYNVRAGYMLERPVYRLYQSVDRAETYDAHTGELLSPIPEGIAVRIAREDFTGGDEVTGVSLVEKKEGEYKGAVPAYRVDFDHWKNPHIYVHANTGVVTARRNSLWRLYDFFWMLHIMDYGERENFNNWIVRVLSLLGLLTISTGFVLWGYTTPLLRKRGFTPRND